VVGIEIPLTSFDPSWHSVDLRGSSSSSSSSGNSKKRATSPVEDEVSYFLENDPNPDPKSDNEDEGDIDEVLTETSIYVGKDLPPEDDIGFSHYTEEEDVPAEVPAKKRKQPEEEFRTGITSAFTVPNWNFTQE